MAPTQHHKAVIIGSGPAGQTAAIYLARTQINPVLFEGNSINGSEAGGELTQVTVIDNFPGFPNGIEGPELMDNLRTQSINCGANIITETITKVVTTSKPFRLWRQGSNEEGKPTDTADAVILATGAQAKRLFIPGSVDYWLKGISASAVSDSNAVGVKGKTVVVIGGGEVAVEEALYLARYAAKVLLLVRSDTLKAPKVLIDRLSKFSGNAFLESITVNNTKTNEEITIPTSAVYYAIGYGPFSTILDDQVERDKSGYVKAVPGTSYTNVKGLFAAGGVRDKKYRQAITASASGCKLH